MRYAKNGKEIPATRARRIVAAALTYIDGFFDQAEADKVWKQAHEQISIGYATRDIIEQNADGFTMRHSNEEAGQ